MTVVPSFPATSEFCAGSVREGRTFVTAVLSGLGGSTSPKGRPTAWRVLVLAVIVGALAGGAAVLLHAAFEWASALLLGYVGGYVPPRPTIHRQRPT